MTKPLKKTDLMRAAWLTELRRQGHRQCTETYRVEGGHVCALGLLAEIAGRKVSPRTRVEAIGKLAGLTGGESSWVADLNDGYWPMINKHTFAQIADVVEGWFPND